MSLYTKRGQATLVFELGLRREFFETQRRRGERMSLYTNRGKARVGIRAGFAKRVSNPAKKGERKCAEIFYLIIPAGGMLIFVPGL